MIFGIDASNLLQGGGRTHLIELLSAAEPENYGVKKIIVYGRQTTLDLLPDRPWLFKRNLPILEGAQLHRMLWQNFELPNILKHEGVDLLFAPGGYVGTGFQPVVTMSQNLLPFDTRELWRFGFSRTTMRLMLLRYAQSHSFRSSTGVIFLTEYARRLVQSVTGKLPCMLATIPHGISPRFFYSPPPVTKFRSLQSQRKARLLYVSIVNFYKHQWHVVDAVHRLRVAGYDLTLDLVGPSHAPAQKRLDEVLERCDPQRAWVKLHGDVPYIHLHKIYQQADFGIFASSCENMPIILLEFMAAGLPIACSNRGPMPEILGDGGLYFDPQDPAELVDCLRLLLENPQLCADLAAASHHNVQQYTWARAAKETFEFLSKIAVLEKCNTLG